MRLLGDATLRFRLVALAALAWAAVVALTCWQALRGQSIVAPDALTLAVGGAVTVVLVLAAVVAVRRASVEVAR